MYDIIFYNGTILGANGPIINGYVLVKDGVIARVGTGKPPCFDAVETVDLNGDVLSPGFIDIHTHGAGGSDFMDGTVDAVLTASRMHLRHGTTTLCPTSVASEDEELFGFMDSYQQARSVHENMPHLAGMHLEGPYFSPNQAGAQQPERMKQPFPDHYIKILERSHGNIVRWSSAPEVPGVIELGDILVRNGILPAIAHTDADFSVVKRAMGHGYSLLTHFYSGMSQLKRVNGYRILGVVEAGYLYDELYVELIADGIHLPRELLQLILKCKAHDHIILVTDSMRAAGMPEGPSILGSLKNNFEVVVEDGVAKMPDRQGFAGSVATADRLIRVMVYEAGLPLHEAVDMITKNPAKLLRIDYKTGSIAEGKAADLVVFDKDIQIKQVYVDGNRVSL
ncbi:MAG TPA: N-acetylglucosamine-6-phosphate deacetylase [Thermoclostridium sp.]